MKLGPQQCANIRQNIVKLCKTYHTTFETKFNSRLFSWFRKDGKILAEVAEFTIAPRFAYDDLGAPPLVPPDATLIFEVELVDFENKSDVLGDGRGILSMTCCFLIQEIARSQYSKLNIILSLHKTHKTAVHPAQVPSRPSRREVERPSREKAKMSSLGDLASHRDLLNLAMTLAIGRSLGNFL